MTNETADPRPAYHIPINDGFYEVLPDMKEDAGECALSASFTPNNGIRVTISEYDIEGDRPDLEISSWSFDFETEQAETLGTALLRWVKRERDEHAFHDHNGIARPDSVTSSPTGGNGCNDYHHPAAVDSDFLLRLVLQKDEVNDALRKQIIELERGLLELAMRPLVIYTASTV